MSRPNIGVVLDSRLAWLEVDQARPILAVGVPATAHPDAWVAASEFVVVLW